MRFILRVGGGTLCHRILRKLRIVLVFLLQLPFLVDQSSTIVGYLMHGPND